jgi:hypothetical protein
MILGVLYIGFFQIEVASFHPKHPACGMKAYNAGLGSQ